MSIDLLRTKRFDERLFQSPPSWTIEQGAISLSSANFASLSATSGQVTFQIQAPSKAVYLDRVVNWQQQVYLTMSVDCSAIPIVVAATGAPAPVYPLTFAVGLVPVATPGRDFALCANPLHSLVSSMQATICDQQVSSNLAQNRELMDLLADSPGDRIWRTHPRAMDVYASYNDAYGTSMNPLASFESAPSNALIGNGSWPIQFVLESGVALTAGVTYRYPATGPDFITVGVDPISLQPCIIGISTALAATTVLRQVPVYLNFTSSEPLQLSPFIWREMMERRTGLSQLQNLNIVMNIQSADSARLIRSTTQNSRAIVSTSLISYGNTGTPFQGAGLIGQFLSPPMSAELPYSPVNTVDYQNIVAYVYPSNQGSWSTAGSQILVQTQTLSLNTIPDWLIIAVQPSPAWYQTFGRQYGTWYLPVSSVSLTWSNVTGLLASQSRQQLFGICKANQLQMSWEQWYGAAQVSTPGKPSTVQLTGGPLVLRPGIDLTLPAGQCSGQSNGQWTFSANIFVDTTNIPQAVLNSFSGNLVNTTVLAINSGFFTTSSGSSRIVTGPISGPAGDDALANIPSAGPLYRPAELALTVGARLPGGGARPRRRMKHRVM